MSWINGLSLEIKLLHCSSEHQPGSENSCSALKLSGCGCQRIPKAEEQIVFMTYASTLPENLTIELDISAAVLRLHGEKREF